MTHTLRIGIIGTSWWVDSMYLPALQPMDGVDVVALSGRSPDPLAALSTRWGVASTYRDWNAMLEQGDLDGVIIAAANDVHAPAALAALDRGLAVVCEKPLANTLADAQAMADAAAQAAVATLVPFTYAFMPGFRWMERLVADGYVGRIHHVGLRYHTGFALDPTYTWKLDARHNPTGALGDIGCHFIFLAQRLAGPVARVTARLDNVGARADLDPQGEPYPLACDTAAVIMDHVGGAQAVLEASTISYEGTSMDQRHVIEVHGDAGTLRYLNDWDEVQQVSGTTVGAGPLRPLPIPDEIWGDLRRGSVHDTYRDVFRTTDVMARGWVRAIADGGGATPDFGDGLAVQTVMDAALRSSDAGQRISLEHKSP